MNSYTLFLKRAVYGVLPAMLLLGSCTKEKLSPKSDYRPVTDARGNTLMRLVNLGDFNQVQVNGDTLTNYTILHPNDAKKYPATKYFPDNGRLGTIWNIPKAVFNEKGEASIYTEAANYNPSPQTGVTINVNENSNEAIDYYLLQDKFYVDELPEWKAVPRDITAPSRPDYCKVRIINLSGKVQNSPMESLEGNMTLTWADGTPVHTATSDIAVEGVSPYIEIPYGTYQLKVLNNMGIQVPAVGGPSGENARLMDVNTSTMVFSLLNQTVESTGLTYVPIQAYQPGGIYTIVIHPATVTYNSQKEDIDTRQNCIRIIEDIAAPANRTYGRVQLVNAWSEGDLQLYIDGAPSGGTAAYTQASEAGAVIAGYHLFEVKSANGTQLASATANLLAGDHFSIWAAPGKDGNASALVVSNNLSGSWNADNSGDDGSLAGRSKKIPLDIRFMNFSNEPFISITGKDGQPYGTTSPQNLQPGIVPIAQPLLSLGMSTNTPYSFMVFRSAPGVVPGTWIADIPVVTSTAFIARPQLYTNASRMLPYMEPGVYSMALVGTTAAGAAPEKKARLMIIKHTK